jgi:hypothetical protein
LPRDLAFAIRHEFDAILQAQGLVGSDVRTEVRRFAPESFKTGGTRTKLERARILSSSAGFPLPTRLLLENLALWLAHLCKMLRIPHIFT